LKKKKRNLLKKKEIARKYMEKFYGRKIAENPFRW